LPRSFKPALQLDGDDARLLIEALRGRWTYEHDWRDKRATWVCVANAFSLILSNLYPVSSKGGITVLCNWDYD